jgi:hypothetical protein
VKLAAVWRFVRNDELANDLWAQVADAPSTAKTAWPSVASSAVVLPAPGEPARFTSWSQLVLLPVVVTGKDGKHMSGLGREAFRIEEQGKPRTPTVFEEVKTVAPDPKAQVLSPMEGHSNFPFGATQNWRITVSV